ncbi:MAG TPA: UDP-2,3-diacylglucosamine diphosphatase LpxI [Fusobacterium sp.]|uniref:LpxI family protein n=1 Tax=Fusobacterium sp. TaxID=68766 RepID=UPI002F40D679
MEKIGIIAGNGKFPLYFMKEAKKQGYDLYPVGLFDSIEKEIKDMEHFQSFHIGHLGEIVKHFSFYGVKNLILLGKVEKSILFQNLDLDYYGQEILKMLPNRKDETLLFAMISFLRLNGIKVLSQNYLLSSLMAEEKCYTKKIPQKEDDRSIQLGIEAARMLTRLDIGQTVIVKEEAVVALEGMEGTDQAILRAGKLAGKNCIIVKMARPKQDMRVDIPTVGVETIRKAMEIGAKGIVMEANKMFFLEREEAISLANEHGIFLIGKKV